jgi:hypothetical protein
MALAAVTRFAIGGSMLTDTRLSRIFGPSFFLVATLHCAGPNEPVTAELQLGDLLFQAGHPPQLATDSITTRVVMKNTGDTSVQVLVAGGCAVTLRIYRTRDKSSVWDSERSAAVGDCAAILSTISLAPGAAKTFQATIAVADILGDSLRHGRYFVESTLNLDQQAVVLQNGEATLK